MRAVESAEVAPTLQAVRRPSVQNITVGKDVLELVSSAMYIDPMTVYREYIQNAADAVDGARAAGVLSHEERGRVDIEVDAAARTVKIRDNGCGVPAAEFGHTLMSLGGSAKRGTSGRGFRGVGRLGGLAYAQEVVFRSRRIQEVDIMELKWDCRRLKAVLSDSSKTMGVADLIRSVTTLERVDRYDAPDHFFEVELRGVLRLRDDRLLNPLAIANYLGQVAPVPFAPGFSFGADLTRVLSKHVNLGELDIRINGGKEPIYRPHRNDLNLGGRSSLTFDELAFVEVPGVDDTVAAVGWVLHHDYQGALPNGIFVKGLRMRTGNLQVGGHALLEDLFPEPRFNSWAVGEVHVVDPRVVPNGRRDQFEENVHLANLINHLAPTARDIARRCRTSSVRRRRLREFDLCAENAHETISVITQGSANHLRRQQLALSVEQTLLHMSKLAVDGLLVDVLDRLEDRIVGLRRLLREGMNEGVGTTSPLARLPEAKRVWYEHFFELVYECSPNRVAARGLIDRILLRLE